MGKKIKKAVFPVAGLGTRFLPATKANPKEMLPVVDKPLIQYAAEEAVSAGIDVLIFVNGRNKRSIPDHFDKAYELESELEARNKEKLLAIARDVLPPRVSCIYIRQSEALGLGHAVLCAKPVVGKDPFTVILADDLIDSGDQPSCTRQMVDVYEKNHCSVIGVQNVSREEVSSYGIVDGEQITDKLWSVNALVEKPSIEESPSTIAIVGRYILEASIFDQLETTERGAGGEIQLTDAIARQLESGKVMAYEFSGKRFDCGNKLGYLQANVEYALKHEEVRDQFKTYLHSLIS
ncbi:MAG: UTP--glucose-1-phosphate uridylyltransferase GalU [Gammaproteobacteria bacterium]|nr:UTP--glucose-1-phosphate uridylyltransferase GalU [Gammaproteobacteria bacterium]